MHSKSPSVMAFCPVCLGILPYSWQNTSRDITCEQLLQFLLCVCRIFNLVRSFRFDDSAYILGDKKQPVFLQAVLCLSHSAFVLFPQHGHFIYCPSGFQESLSSLFSISSRSTVYATFTSLSFLTINSESPYSEPLSAQSYVYPSLVHGYFPSK